MNRVTNIKRPRSPRRRRGDIRAGEPALGHYSLIGAWHPGATRDCPWGGCRGDAR